jgi:hypothetical protein
MEQTMLRTALIVLAALLMTDAALAQGPSFPRDLTVSWTNASTYTDGSAIEAGDLTGLRVECTRNGDPVVAAVIPASGVGTAQTHTLAGAIARPGTYVCVGYSVVIGGIESVASNSSSVKHVGQPNQPSTFTVR